MKIFWASLLTLFLIFFGVSGCSSEKTPKPLLQDHIQILNSKQKRKILSFLEFTKEKYQIDYHILLLPSLPSPHTRIEDLTVDEFKNSKIGQTTKGRGLLLVICKAPPVARVEVGYALEGFVTDLEASSIIDDYLRPYFAHGEIAPAIEVSVEMLLNTVKEKMNEEDFEVLGSGGAGAKTDLTLEGFGQKPSKSDINKIKTIMVPQATPSATYDLELTLLKKGIYHYDLPFFDATWHKRQGKRSFSPRALQRSYQIFKGPYEVFEKGKFAIIYYSKYRKNAGPSFLKKNLEGWILDRTQTAKMIHYNYDSTGWFAYDEDYPWLALLKEVYDLKSVRLQSGQKAFEIK